MSIGEFAHKRAASIVVSLGVNDALIKATFTLALFS
jgi:hypothetical protein